jgi:UDP-N-acetylmuramoyl-L-alanyl-D-glutamate--2,6-diaminopimelate ligase
VTAGVARPPLPAPPILVLGLARAGEAATRALAARLGPDAVFAADDHATEATRATAERLRALGVAVALGPRPADWPRPTAIVRSPGIELDAPSLAIGVPVIDELELGWRLSGERVVGVTGTNGKGTTSWLLAHTLPAAGLPATLCGNFELGDPFSAASVDPGGAFVVEVSSFQLEATDSLLPEVAVLTNLGDDHRDRHGPPETYGPLKRRMFVRGDRVAPVAVLAADDGFARGLAVELRDRGGRVITFGCAADADYRIVERRSELGLSEVTIAAPGGEIALRTSLPGLHNARNAVGALAAAEALGAEREACVAALARAPGVPGRFESIDVGQPFTACVDYAHNPDGYRAVLPAARELTRGRLRVLIGAMGGMDPHKRPEMGRLAATLADHVVLSNADDRGGESRERRMGQLLEGARDGDAEIVPVPDRRQAIATLVGAAEPGDVVLVLGRGARGHPLWDGGEPFDDRDELRAALRELVDRDPSVTASPDPSK